MEYFKDYISYKQYVKEEWEEGYINELTESGFIIEVPGCNNQDIQYRLLTEDEYNKKFLES